MQQQITNLSLSALKIHPRNQEFYDDIEGKNYEQFKNSIQEEGIITPLLVAPDMTLISGHQRYKAATELEIESIPVMIDENLKDEDEKLKKLIAANFGRLENNPKKQRKAVSTYAELCGLKNGQRKSELYHNDKAQQDEIAKKFNISVAELNRIIAIERKLTPEVKEFLDTGVISKTSASMIWTKLSPKEQNELLEELGKDKLEKMTQQQLQQYLKEHKEQQEILQNKLQELQTKLDENNIDELLTEKEEVETKLQEAQTNERTAYEELGKLKLEKEKIENEKEEIIKQKLEIEQQIEELKNQEPEIIEKEVIPDDVKEKLKQLKKLEKDFKEKNIEYERVEKEVRQYREKYRVGQHYLGFKMNVEIFLDAVSRLAYKKEELKDLPEEEKTKFKEQVNYLTRWIDEFNNNIK